MRHYGVPSIYIKGQQKDPCYLFMIYSKKQKKNQEIDPQMDQ